MIEHIGIWTVSLVNKEQGYSIRLNDKEYWFVPYHKSRPEAKAELAFSSVVAAIKLMEGKEDVF
jgi:hypothetical protein